MLLSIWVGDVELDQTGREGLCELVEGETVQGGAAGAVDCQGGWQQQGEREQHRQPGHPVCF